MTDLILDKYDLLDPARMLRDIEAQTDAVLFDRYSVLDPALQRRQMEDGLGITLTEDAVLDPSRMMTEVAAAVAESYVARAVFFDSSTHTHLFRSSLTASDSPFLLFSLWVKFQNIDVDPAFFAGKSTADPNPGVAVGIVGFYNDGDIGFRTYGNAAAENGQALNVDVTSDNGIFTAGAMHHICGAADTAHGPGAKLLSLLLDGHSVGTNIKSLGFSDDHYDSFNVGFDDSPFGLPYQDDAYLFNAASEATSDVTMADYQLFSPSSYPDLTDPAVLAKLITEDGKPVDPSVAAEAFGPPLILFSGDASTFGVNQGTAGTFTLTGTLTDADDLVELGDGAYVPPAPPVNDDFANATVISLGDTLTGSNALGSKQSGEPDHAFDSGGHSVWWKFTAPSSADVHVSLAGSSFDTLLGVYTGASVDALTEITSNDDSGGSQSALTFTPVDGTTYHFAVDGYGGATGSVSIAVSAAA